MEHLTQATELGCAPDHILCCPSAGAEAWAGDKTGLLPVCVFPESPGCCGHIPGVPLHPGAVGRPLGVSGVGCWAFLPQGPCLFQLQGAALAECLPACEVLPQGGPGKSLPDACCGVHQGGGLPSGLICQGRQGQAWGHPPAGTGSLTLVWSWGWAGAGRLTQRAGDTSCLG